jgi:phosphate transport system substrate-binding protein
MKKWIAALLIIYSVVACNNQQDEARETPAKGRIRISVDESFKPVIEEQLKVFRIAYPEATIIAEYKPEAGCLKDLQTDSTRMVIISRDLTDEEDDAYSKKLSFKPQYGQIAEDAVAIVLNKNIADSAFTLEELKGLLLGKSDKKLNVVVDGKSATSTVRYLIDSVLKGAPLGTNVTGANSSEDLIKYISTTENSIGFVGISWVTNPQNKEQEEALTKVKTALLECKNCEKDEYARPSQQTIMFNQYPLVRGLHYVLKENSASLGSGFRNFLSLERGQLIFRRANLVPTRIHFNRRRTKI